MKEVILHRIILTEDELQTLAKTQNIADNLSNCGSYELSSIGKSLRNALMLIEDVTVEDCSIIAEVINDFTVDGSPYSEDIIVDWGE